ncbi:hypothetical protein LCGC14_1392310, partial [marine sediment metagenome]
VRHGSPGVGMVALILLDIESVIDIIAFAQTLPTQR